MRETPPEERDQAKFNAIVMDLRRKPENHRKSDDDIWKLATAQMNQQEGRRD